MSQKRRSIKFLKSVALLAVGCFLLFATSCSVSKSVAGKNVSFLYEGKMPVLHLETKVLNFEDRSTIYLKFKSEDLERSEYEDGSLRVNYSIRYRLYTTYSSPTALDSANLVRKDVLPAPGNMIDTFSIRGLENRGYLVECTIRDLNTPQSNTVFIPISRSDQLNEQKLILNSSSKGLLYHPLVEQVDSIRVSSLGAMPTMARYYNRTFPVSLPPFSSTRPKPFDFTPDSIIALEPWKEGVSTFTIIRKGFYHLVEDSASRSGATLYYYGPHFPEAKTVMDLALPLRYVTTNEEYSALFEGDNIKRNVDEYWLKVGGSPNRARELIQAYYGRVQYANVYFSSYLEGWKSDRGMCYVVYGPPDAVYRKSGTETWVYGEEGRYNALTLTFTKVTNPFTDNDYRLNRMASLKTSWYRAVELWRQGRVLKYE
jgi:GWxTD domain-containing protein